MRSAARERSSTKLLSPFYARRFSAAPQLEAWLASLEEANLFCIHYVHLADHQAVHYHYHYHGKKAPVTNSGEIS